MTYMYKTFIIAMFGAAALTAQVSTAYAMGSDRDPTTTNLFSNAANHQVTVPQKNTVVTSQSGETKVGSFGNEFFLAQR